MAKFKINISPSLSRLDLVIKGTTNSPFMGNYASGFKGKGFEFDGFRKYTFADDASRIDWKTSARSDRLLIKEFVEERNIDVFFVVDVSSKMMLGSTKRLKTEYVADLVASLAHTILRAGDRVGLMLFSDKVTKIVYPTNGMKHFHSLSDSLSNLSFYGGGCEIKKAMDELTRILNKGSIVFLISDFITDENLESSLKYAGQKFDLTAIVVRDPIDMELPTGIGQIMIQDPTYGEKILVTPKRIAPYYASEAKAHLRDVKKSFFKSNVDLIELSTKRPFINKLIEFFEWRKDRWK
jgi:uncharacterized protein (DUF58 family)